MHYDDYGTNSKEDVGRDRDNAFLHFAEQLLYNLLSCPPKCTQLRLGLLREGDRRTVVLGLNIQ